MNLPGATLSLVGDNGRITLRMPDEGDWQLSATTPDSIDPAGQHELFDRRRSTGLRAATGEIVAMLEDRGVPRRDWASRIVDAHGQRDAVIGGAVENGIDSWLNWAVYFCDFVRYQLPFDAETAKYVTDVNVSYSKSVLQATRHLWAEPVPRDDAALGAGEGWHQPLPDPAHRRDQIRRVFGCHPFCSSDFTGAAFSRTHGLARPGR